MDGRSSESFIDLHRRLSMRTSPFASSDEERTKIRRYLRVLSNELPFVQSQTMLPDDAIARAYSDYVNTAVTHPYVLDIMLQDTHGEYDALRGLAATVVDAQEKAQLAAHLASVDQLARNNATSEQAQRMGNNAKLAKEMVPFGEVKALLAKFDVLSFECRTSPPTLTSEDKKGGTYTLRCPVKPVQKVS